MITVLNAAHHPSGHRLSGHRLSVRRISDRRPTRGADQALGEQAW
jgi:hypothetical protein